MLDGIFTFCYGVIIPTMVPNMVVISVSISLLFVLLVAECLKPYISPRKPSIIPKGSHIDVFSCGTYHLLHYPAADVENQNKIKRVGQWSVG